MKQTYHKNATTNKHTRCLIKSDCLSNVETAQRFNISTKTVAKWKARESTEDKSSRPHNVAYALSEVEKGLVLSIRKTTWDPLDAIHDTVAATNPLVSRSSVYRELCHAGIQRKPEGEKERAKAFKEYGPGFLHIDVTYLPRVDGDKQYLFVAIDRATRLMYYKVYAEKTAGNAASFLSLCAGFFPFAVSHVMTDNGLEFTNMLIRSRKGALCTKVSRFDEVCANKKIDHRLTLPATPKTNGMVERANGTIKSNTVLKRIYGEKEAMGDDLMAFLVFYNMYRGHGGLKKELAVATPMDAVDKWYGLQPDIFKEKPNEFKEKLLLLKINTNVVLKEQRCET